MRLIRVKLIRRFTDQEVIIYLLLFLDVEETVVRLAR